MKRQMFINGKQWKVKKISNLVDEDNKPCWGLCNYSDRTIILDKNHPTEGDEIDTLIHEIVHGVFYEHDVKMSVEKDENVTRELTKLLLYCFKIKLS